MAFPDFLDNTFVAFCDISGFKQKMARNPTKAIHALEHFYSIVYTVLQKTRNQSTLPVYGLLVSDCAILVVDDRSHRNPTTALQSLLAVVKQINEDALPYDLMLTTSIAFGPFIYSQRAEFFGIEKNMLAGAAYIEAYKDQSGGKPKLKCGECRIVRENLPPQILAELENNQRTVFPMVEKDRGCFYYYWMRRTREDIQAFKDAYRDTDDLKFLGIRLLLQGHQDLNVVGNNNP